jgi:hypothetical protein
VNDVGLKLAKSAARAPECRDEAEWRFVKIKANDWKRGGPFFFRLWQQRHQRYGVTALGHALGKREHLFLSASHAQRGKHVHDPHSIICPEGSDR